MEVIKLESLPNARPREIRNKGTAILSNLHLGNGEITNKMGAIFRRLLRGEDQDAERVRELEKIIQERRDDILDLIQEKSCVRDGRETDEIAQRELAEKVLAEIEAKITKVLGSNNSIVNTQDGRADSRNIEVPKDKEIILKQNGGKNIILTPSNGNIHVYVENEEEGKGPIEYDCQDYSIEESKDSYYLTIYDVRGGEASWGYTIEEPEINT